MVNESKPVRWLQVMNAMTSKVKQQWRTYFTNEPNNIKCLMTMTNYVQLFVFVLYWLLMKLYNFANFVQQHLVPYEYTSISFVVIEVSMWLLYIEGDFIVW